MPVSSATSNADLSSAVVAGNMDAAAIADVAPAASTGRQVRNDQQRAVHRQLTHAVTTHRDFNTMLNAVADAVCRIIRPAAVCYAGRDGQPRLLEVKYDKSDLSEETRRNLPSAIGSSCRKVGQLGQADIDAVTVPGSTVISVPVFLRGRPPEVISLVLVGRGHRDRDVLLLQLAATHVSFWYLIYETRGNSTLAAAQSEMFRQLVGSKSERQAASVLASGICQAVGCDRVAVATSRGDRGTVVLQAWSGVRGLDRRGELAGLAEAACREAVLQAEPVHWPASDETGTGGNPAFQRLAAATGVESVLAFPLRDNRGRPAGVCLLLGTRDQLSNPQIVPHLQSMRSWAADGLALVSQARSSLPVLLWRRLKDVVAMGRKRLIAAAVIGLALLLGLPVPHEIGCDCTMEPVTRRYVAAPYDGVLERALVDAGDVVAPNQVLARMDDREIRWELASLYADRAAALKKRDAAMASHDAAAVQFAKLDVERLDLKIRVLQQRADHLELKAPVGGMVVVGDLEKAEGAPLSMGQSLFEIAPLNAMVVEFAVPEEDISYVRAGMTARFRLDAYPGRQWEGRVEQIHPRAEERAQQQVFVAELAMQNPGQLWKPGMSGRAKIVAQHRPLGWVLLHKAWERTAMKLGW